MRATVTLDDELVAKARRYTGIEEKSALVSKALRELVALEAARELAGMGGTDPGATAPPRRRSLDDADGHQAAE